MRAMVQKGQESEVGWGSVILRGRRREGGWWRYQSVVVGLGVVWRECKFVFVVVVTVMMLWITAGDSEAEPRSLQQQLESK